jgi:hypothetical protein
MRHRSIRPLQPICLLFILGCQGVQIVFGSLVGESRREPATFYGLRPK